MFGTINGRGYRQGAQCVHRICKWENAKLKRIIEILQEDAQHILLTLYHARTHAYVTGTQPGGQHKPLQPVSPSFVHPDEQSPQILPPGVFTHARLLWQPPLSVRAHSFTSSHKNVCKRSTQQTYPLSAMHQCSAPFRCMRVWTGG